ncbi:MAG TPA: hypothetical protein VFV10_06990 [Gammaproteobacteria bacterium]|nr:hypothetical protein [Gammaproteobacteria bacterium]
MIASAASSSTFALVEECAGRGELACDGRVFSGVAYRISRFQGMSRSGLPIPGLHRFEGSVDLRAVEGADELVDRDVTMRLEDGRTLRMTVASPDGRVLQEGHGPSRCSCC